MRHICVWVALLTVLPLTMYLVEGAAVWRSADEVGALVSLAIEDGPRRIPLNRKEMALAGAEGEGNAAVALERRIYRFRALSVEDGRVQLSNGRLFSYDLRALRDAQPFSWSICSLGSPLGMFRLLTSEDGQNHLAWSDGHAVCFAQIDAARDRAVAITKAVSAQTGRFAGVVRIPTDVLIERQYHHPGDRPANAFFTELAVESIETTESGTTIVRVSSPRKQKDFLLVFDGRTWRAERL